MIKSPRDGLAVEKCGRLLRSGRRLSEAVTESGTEREAAVSRYFETYVEDRDEHGATKLSFAARNFPQSALMFARLMRLPRLTITPSDSLEGIALRDAFVRHHPVSRLIRHAAVVLLPGSADEYCSGSSKQTLRRKIRQAQKLGVGWKPVDDPQERRRVLALADDWERVQPDAQYQNPEPANDDLFEYDLWLLAHSADGRPLVLSVTPVDGGWAALRYFRTIGSGVEQSVARYYLMRVLVDRLCQLGVGHLVDATSPSSLTNGLRHYQRMVGFRIFRVRLQRSTGKRAQ